jgi:hypothetical protein
LTPLQKDWYIHRKYKIQKTQPNPGIQQTRLGARETSAFCERVLLAPMLSLLQTVGYKVTIKTVCLLDLNLELLGSKFKSSARSFLSF